MAGAVPQRWEVLSNRAILAEVKDRITQTKNCYRVTITRASFNRRNLLAGSSKKDSSNLTVSLQTRLSGRYRLQHDERVAGSHGSLDFRGIISPAYVVMRLRHEHTMVLPRALSNAYFAKAS